MEIFNLKIYINLIFSFEQILTILAVPIIFKSMLASILPPQPFPLGKSMVTIYEPLEFIGYRVDGIAAVRGSIE